MQSVTRHALGRSIDELREAATESDDALVSHFEDISLYPESTMPTAALAATSAAALHFGSDPSGARVETRVAARRAEQIYLGCTNSQRSRRAHHSSSRWTLRVCAVTAPGTIPAR